MGSLALLYVLRHHLARSPLAIFAHFVDVNQYGRNDERKTADIGQEYIFVLGVLVGQCNYLFAFRIYILKCI